MSLDCSNIEKVKDITDQIDYKDKVGGGRGDSNQVSCGQSKDDELQDKFDEHFKGVSKENWIAKIMCNCCNQLKPTGKEKVTCLKFYQCINVKRNPKMYHNAVQKCTTS